MFELGIWLVAFLLLLVVTFLAGKHHAESSAVRRILKRHDHADLGSFDERNASELELRIEQATRRLKLGATELKKLKKISYS